MAMKLLKTKTGRTVAMEIAADEALVRAQALWDTGDYEMVKLIDDAGAPVWKRGSGGSPEQEAREQAAICAAAGLSRIRIACDGIGGLADLDQPLSPEAQSFEIAADGVEFRPVLTSSGSSPRVRDLLSYLDAHVADDAVAFTGWQVTDGPWPNPAHKRVSVNLAP